MTDNQNSTFLTDKEISLEELRQKGEIANFESKHNLEYPINASTQTKTSLSSLFAMLRYYLEVDVVREIEISWYYREFLQIPDENKPKCITALHDLFEFKYNQNIDLQAIVITSDANRDAEEIAAKLSPELREEFYYYINTGEELTQEMRQAINDEIEDNSQLESYLKLEKAFDMKQTLNIGLRNPQKGRAMTPDEVAQKYNLERSIASDEDVETQAEDKDPIAKLSSQTQSLYELVKLNRDRITKETKKKNIQTQRDMDDAIVTGTRSKPIGLDELLKK
jgi:hypothetical protein